MSMYLCHLQLGDGLETQKLLSILQTALLHWVYETNNYNMLLGRSYSDDDL